MMDDLPTCVRLELVKTKAHVKHKERLRTVAREATNLVLRERGFYGIVALTQEEADIVADEVCRRLYKCGETYSLKGSQPVLEGSIKTWTYIELQHGGGLDVIGRAP
jgi:hypothetical protein